MDFRKRALRLDHVDLACRSCRLHNIRILLTVFITNLSQVAAKGLFASHAAMRPLNRISTWACGLIDMYRLIKR
jgi:hypothetical protein